MGQRDYEPLVRGGGDELVRDVLGSARADVPPAGARKQALAALAATSSPSPFWRRLGGRAALHGIGLAVSIGAASLIASFMSASDSARAGRPASPPSSAVVAAPAVLSESAPSPISPPPASVVTSHASVATPGASVVVATRGAPSARVASSVYRPSPPPASSVETADDSTLGREIARVKGARAALAAGDPSRTLQLLDQYDAEFPSGAFSLEVSVLRIEALARSGRVDEARRLGDRFLAQQPEGAFARRVKATLRSAAPP